MAKNNTFDMVPKGVDNMIGQVLDPISQAITIPPTEIVPDRLDNFMSGKTIFTIIVISQGLFGGMGLQYTPTFIKDLSKKWYWRFVFVCAIAFTATSDADIALIVTLVYFLFLHFMKTKEEKKKYPNIF
jgi:hypothetical protein